MSDACRRCDGAGWVCESHPYRQWSPAGCMCDAGVPCRCNDDPQRNTGLDSVTARVVNERKSAMLTVVLVLVCVAAVLALAFGGEP